MLHRSEKSIREVDQGSQAEQSNRRAKRETRGRGFQIQTCRHAELAIGDAEIRIAKSVN